MAIARALVNDPGIILADEPTGNLDSGTAKDILSLLAKLNDDGNTILGKCIAVESSNSILRTEDDHLIATVGVKNLIIVHTKNATLVANRDDEESVRKIVQLLEKEGMQEYL